MVEDTAFYGSLQKQLEDLIVIQKQERKDDADMLRSLMEIKEAEAKKDGVAKKLGLDGGKEFAFFGLISEHAKEIPIQTQENKVILSKEIISIVEERAVAEWTEREDIQKEMRREIKRLLRTKDCNEDDLPALVREFMELAQQWVKR